MGRLGFKRDWIEKIDRATRDYSPEDLITTGTSLDAETASAVLDLALRVSELALRVGASASGATAFALTVTRTYGLNVDIDVTWGAITISYQRTGVWEPVTGFRSVRDRYRDYQALGRLTGFVDDVAAGKFTLAEAREKFSVIRRAGRPYRRWLRAVAYGVFGMTVATMLGGYGVETWLSGISMVLLFGVKRSLARLGVAPFFQHARCSAVFPTCRWGSNPNFNCTICDFYFN
ncbi:MAG: hypothetical protein CSA83_02880 [Actinomycetales bacterium]|nr:MAG: hypothetical protein CSA83_02880 [Actinomycetales bacterium]